ncbi:MAG: tRNA-(ms[2]io[6]A)-hydroxylase [Bacteroidota bacterium]|nr:tRNA-(ms[2]io[6]A)-hydroxylase [Bacteroidota bacterium]
MLKLKLATDPRWVNIAEKSIAEILTDHAYCEQKAATSGISMIIACPGHTRLVNEMTSLVAEEWGHFRKVYKELEKRNLPLGHKRKDEYVIALLKLKKSGRDQEFQTCENLLLNAMIEARSCERFRLLSLNMEDEYFRKFYHEFMVSEAGHYTMYIDLAKDFMPEEHVATRWEEILEGEAKILAQMELRGDRVH